MFISNGWILQDIPRTTTRTSDIPLFVFGIDRNVYQSYFLTPFKLRLNGDMRWWNDYQCEKRNQYVDFKFRMRVLMINAFQKAMNPGLPVLVPIFRFLEIMSRSCHAKMVDWDACEWMSNHLNRPTSHNYRTCLGVVWNIASQLSSFNGSHCHKQQRSLVISQP